jgi:hypothetical protein
MAIPVFPLRPAMAGPTPTAQPEPRREAEGALQLGQRFEQMLWAEMLSHSGLEKAFTQNGGEAAASFSRYIVEAISEDLARTHPLGFADEINLPATGEPTVNTGNSESGQ